MAVGLVFQLSRRCDNSTVSLCSYCNCRQVKHLWHNTAEIKLTDKTNIDTHHTVYSWPFSK